MQWKHIFIVILITVCVQTDFIKAQGFLDPFGLRRRDKERGNESKEEEREADGNSEPRRTFPGLDWFKPFDINFGRERDRQRGRRREKDQNGKQESYETMDEARIGEIPMPRSLGTSTSEKDENKGDEEKGKLEYGPCGPNNQFCHGENYVKELGLKWSTRVHNGTGIYLRDPNAPGGKRYILVGIDVPDEKYGYCTTPKDKPGYCRHLEHCILDEFRNNFITFLQYRCDIPNQNYVGTCCPRSTEAKEPESRTMPDGRDLPPRFPPLFDLPSLDLPSFRRRTTTTPPRRRTTTRSRGGSTVGRPQSRQYMNCGLAEVKTSRIVGGRPADPKAYPWMTALLKTTEATDHRAGQYCGGVLISEFHVLTAAHCVDGFDTSILAVRVGEYDFSRRNSTSSPEDIRIADAFIHENFNRYTYQNDIAILKLARSAYYEARIKSICLPRPQDVEDALVNEKGIVTGFGTLWYGGPVSDYLQEITVPIWSQQDCQNAYTQPIEDTNLCAGVRAGSRDSCQGDSGGPLQLQRQGRYTVVGIVSWGIRCSEPGFPGVYTRVAKYIPWIAGVMQQ